MGFAIRGMIVGSMAVAVGVWWLFDGLFGGLLEQIVGGMLWKGPLFLAAGLVVMVLSYRSFRKEKARLSKAEQKREMAGEGTQAAMDLLNIFNK